SVSCTRQPMLLTGLLLLCSPWQARCRRFPPAVRRSQDLVRSRLAPARRVSSDRARHRSNSVRGVAAGAPAPPLARSMACVAATFADAVLDRAAARLAVQRNSPPTV